MPGRDIVYVPALHRGLGEIVTIRIRGITGQRDIPLLHVMTFTLPVATRTGMRGIVRVQITRVVMCHVALLTRSLRCRTLAPRGKQDT